MINAIVNFFCCCRKKSKENEKEINLERVNNENQNDEYNSQIVKKIDNSNVSMMKPQNNFIIKNNDEKNTNKSPFYGKIEMQNNYNNVNSHIHYNFNNIENVLIINNYDLKKSENENNNLNILNSEKSIKNKNFNDNNIINLNEIKNNPIELNLIKNFQENKIYYQNEKIFNTQINEHKILYKKTNSTEYQNILTHTKTFNNYYKNKNELQKNDLNKKKNFKHSEKNDSNKIKNQENNSIKKQKENQKYNLINEKHEMKNFSILEKDEIKKNNSNKKINNSISTNNEIKKNQNKKINNSNLEHNEIQNDNSINIYINKNKTNKEKNEIQKKLEKNLEQNKIQNNIEKKSQNFLDKNKILFKNFEHIKVGLKNLGNTCYLNCVLQNLINIIPLTYCFLNEQYTINKANMKGYEGQMAISYSDLLKNLLSTQKNNKNYFEPKNFLSTVKQCNILFNNFNVHDAMEFNIFFLDALHEDTNLYIKKENDVNLPKNPNIKAIDDEYSFDNWKKYVNYVNKSIIVDLFFGTVKYSYTCNICNNKTCIFELYTVLALPLSDKVKDYSKKIKDKIDISQCFQYYFNKEKNDTNLYYCNVCKKDVKRDSKISILTSPPYLIIHLIRTFNRTKNFNFIDYPIKDFDASKYVENCKEKYDLIGIINHYGEYGSVGHFTAYCKKDEIWYEFDDAGVHIIEEDNIKSNNSYVLFYKRQNVMEEIDFEKIYEKYKNNNL